MGEKYEKNFLTSVVLRIDFFSVIDTLTVNLPRKVIAKLKNYQYELVGERILSQFSIQFGQIPSQQQQQQQPPNNAKEWTFINGAKKIVLSNQYVFLEITKYDSYSMIESEFLDIWKALNQSVKDEFYVKRFGMRYVNEIDLGIDKNPTNWKKLLAPQLQAISLLHPETNELSRAMHDAYLNKGEFYLHCQLGMYNPDFPAAINKKVFIIDFDAYKEGIISSSEIDPLIGSCHSAIKEKFETLIGDDLRKLMHG